MAKRKRKSAKTRRELGALREAREQYADRWERSAVAFESQGLYSWMTGRLSGLHLILEVGCGDGRSTLELVRQGHRVISVDENPTCIERARARLENEGIACDVLLRGSQVGTQASYDITYAPLNPALAPRTVLLVEADVVTDPFLEGWLCTMGPFDGVVCALIGTHTGRQGHRFYHDVTSNGDYRVRVQNRMFELAGRTLRSGGRFLLVDRREKPTPMTIADAVSTHRHQASELAPSLDVSDDVDHRVYQPPADGVPMQETRGLSGRSPDFSEHALVAIHAVQK